MSRPLYGSALRAKRNDINYSNAEAQVHDAMPGLIATHLPALSGCPLDPEEFGAQVQNFQRFLRTEYPDIKRLKIAYEFLADFVAKGNEQGLWQLDIPAIIVSVSRTTTSRSHTNFRHQGRQAVPELAAPVGYRKAFIRSRNQAGRCTYFSSFLWRLGKSPSSHQPRQCAR